MPKYGVHASVIKSVVIEVEAENAKEAVKKMLAGEGEEFDSSDEELVIDDSYEVVEEYTGHQETIEVEE